MDQSVREVDKAKAAARKKRQGPQEDTDSDYDPDEFEDMEHRDLLDRLAMNPEEKRKYE